MARKFEKTDKVWKPKNDPISERQFRRMHLKISRHFANRQWAVDMDYIRELEEQEFSKNPEKAREAQDALDYLNKFAGEYYRNTGISPNYDPENPPLNVTDEHRKDCYNRMNLANRDLYAIKHATGWLQQDEVAVKHIDAKPFNIERLGDGCSENDLIRKIDIERRFETGEFTEEQMWDILDKIEAGELAAKTKKKKYPSKPAVIKGEPAHKVWKGKLRGEINGKKSSRD